MIEEPEYEYPVFPVAISQAHNLGERTVLELVKRRLKRIEAQLEIIARNREELESRALPRKYWLDATYLDAQFTAEAQWLRDFISDLESGRLDWQEEKHLPAGEPSETAHAPHAKEEQ